MKFGTWNVRRMYRAVAEEDIVGVQEVTWDGRDTERADEYTFLYGTWDENHKLGTCFLRS
jgi:endonuclease/exonuclease/phosphatase family metal-dependent hydrolase